MGRYNNYLTIHIIALTGAIALHGGIAALAMAPSKPVAIAQQVIQVNMVAPSSIAQVKESEIEVKQDVPPKSDGIRKVKPKTEKKKKQQNEVEKDFVNTLTSGPQDKNSTEKVAAHSEPVFNAVYLQNPAPVYPATARRSGTQGKVLLEVAVTAEGTARDVVISTSSGSGILDEAAINAVRKWRFIPAKQAGEIVEAKVIVPIEFKLN